MGRLQAHSKAAVMLAGAFALVAGLSPAAARAPKRKPPAPAPAPAPVAPPLVVTKDPATPKGFTLPPHSYGFTVDTVEVFPPPKTGTNVNPWCEAFNDTRIAGTGTVLIQYMRLYASINNQTVCLVNDDYTQVAMTGGDYTRWPWYGGTGIPNSLWSLPATPGGITLQINNANNIWHFFNGSHPSIVGAAHLWVQVAVKITGSAVFDFGWDYYDAEGNYVTEGASTRPYGAADCPSTTILTIGK